MKEKPPTVRDIDIGEDEKLYEWSTRVHQQREIDTTTLEGGESAHTFTTSEIEEHLDSFGDRDERSSKLMQFIAPLFR